VSGLRSIRNGLAGSPEEIPVADILPADSPRTGGENAEHIRQLAEVGAKLPPIVVNRRTMQVIDGTHRLRAAALCGADVIEVLFFDGTSTDAFILAVELNRAHGLPLSRADRTAAAARILGTHPDWSNRRIAAVAGIAPTTVGVIRKRSTDQNVQSDTRLGKDGRVRPNDGVEGRRRAGEVIARNPRVSLREIARAAGISPSTAGDVRARLDRGEQPVPPRRQDVARPSRRAGVAAADSGDVIANLRHDPSLRFSEAGRVLLRVLDACAIDARKWDEIVRSVPSHQRGAVMHLARECAGSWQSFADQLARKTDDVPPGRSAAGDA